MRQSGLGVRVDAILRSCYRTANFKRGFGCARTPLLRGDHFSTRAVASAAGLLRPLEHTRDRDVATDEPLLAGVAGRYASALYELAAEEGRVDA